MVHGKSSLQCSGNSFNSTNKSETFIVYPTNYNWNNLIFTMDENVSSFRNWFYFFSVLILSAGKVGQFKMWQITLANVWVCLKDQNVKEKIFIATPGC